MTVTHVSVYIHASVYVLAGIYWDITSLCTGLFGTCTTSVRGFKLVLTRVHTSNLCNHEYICNINPTAAEFSCTVNLLFWPPIKCRCADLWSGTIQRNTVDIICACYV